MKAVVSSPLSQYIVLTASTTLYSPVILPHVWKLFFNMCTDHNKEEYLHPHSKIIYEKNLLRVKQQSHTNRLQTAMWIFLGAFNLISVRREVMMWIISHSCWGK